MVYQPITPDQIDAICRRAFGSEVNSKSLQEISGGTFNTVYLINLETEQAILRIAPPATADLLWDDLALMRREYQIRPFFAAIAPLMPKIILADFTHQLIDRDYMVQSFIEGERWDYLEDELTVDENLALWRQLGQIVKRIHTTTGEWFGWPSPGPQFSRWSELVIDRFERMAASMQQEQLDTTAFNTILGMVQSQSAWLDEIRQPCLLHGDLWLFNVIVSQHETGPQITGIIDADRAWWGDPMADMLMFLLAVRRDEPEWQEAQAAFWAAYEPPENGQTAQFRDAVYQAMHLGSVGLWYFKNQKPDVFKRAGEELRKIAHLLPRLIG